MRAVLDTNILIDHVNGIEAARRELAQYDAPAISIVTWIEVLAGARLGEETAKVGRFLARFELIQLTEPVARRAVQIRRSRRIRLPDAIIQATAQELNCFLVTRNAKDFPEGTVGIRVPYTL